MSELLDLQKLAQAFGLLMVLFVVLLELLVRLVPSLPGPLWWSRACLLALAGLASQAATASWGPGFGVLAQALWLLALGCVAEGLLRFAGRRRLLPWVAGAVLFYVLAALVLLLRDAATAQQALAALSFAGAWGAVGLAALLQAREGLRAVMTGMAAAAGVAALGAALRAWQLWQAGPAGQPGGRQSEGLMLWLMVVACALLLLLFLLAVILELLAQWQRGALHDPLTGALNRRGFEQHTARLAALSARLGQSLVVLMLDIDHFRQLNERHGSAIGDMALKSLGQLVQRAKRESDAFARLGGEEFCMVLPGTDVPGARVFADRLRHSFAAFEIDTGENFLSCTISIGVAYASAAALQTGSVDLVDLLRQADEALDEAKRAGRNRIRFFASPEVMSSRLDSRLFTSTMPHPEH